MQIHWLLTQNIYLENRPVLLQKNGRQSREKDQVIARKNDHARERKQNQTKNRSIVGKP